MFTSSRRALRLDGVLFVERSGELLNAARLNTEGMEPKGNRVLIGRTTQGWFKLHVIDPKPGDLPMDRLKLE